MTKDIYVFNSKKNASIYIHGAIEDQESRERLAYLDFYQPASARRRLQSVLSPEDLEGLAEVEVLGLKKDRKFYVSALKSCQTGLLMKDHWAIIEDKGSNVLVLHIKFDGVVYEDLWLNPAGANNRFIGFINDTPSGANAFTPQMQSATDLGINVF
ncbi:MAG: hypothetical protein ACPGOV_13495 [Magnetovibrionaceae bacterium]